MTASALIDARSFHDQLVREVTAQVNTAVAQQIAAALRDGFRGLQVSVAAPQVTVAAPNVSVESAEITGLEDLAAQMAEIRSLLGVMIAVLRQPVTRTIQRDDHDEIVSVTERRG